MKKLLRVLVVAALLVAIAIPCFADATTTTPPHTHTWERDTANDVAATCTTAKKLAYKCACGETETHEDGKPLGHVPGAVTITVEPKCNTAGKGTWTCTRTGCTHSEDVTIEPTGKHVARDVKDNEGTEKGKPANCSEDGYKATKICEKCGIVLATEVIPKTPNANHVESTKTVASTCTVKGYTQKVCAKCGKELGAKTELPLAAHDVDDTWREVSPATCTNNQVLGQFCKVCNTAVNKKQGEDKLNHKLPTEWTVEKEATCTEKGKQNKACEREGCDYVKSEEIKALGHKKTAWIVDVAPTCTEKGKQHKECERCDAILNADTEIPATGHKEKTVETKATCTEDGSLVTTCETCGAVLQTVTLPKTGHDNGEWKVTKEAKPCQEGEMQLLCTKCGAVLDTKVLAATADHQFGTTATVIKAATCTEDGLKGIVCTVCGAAKEGATEVIPATGHTPGEWKIVRQPSATREGKKVQECTVCGAQLGKKYIPATGSTSTKTSGKTIAFVKGEEVADYAKIDLSKDAITELDLVDAKGAKVGKLVVEVKEGNVTVKYELSAVPTEAFLTFVNEAPSKDITAEKAYEFEKAISVADDLAGAAAAYIYVKIEF